MALRLSPLTQLLAAGGLAAAGGLGLLGLCAATDGSVRTYIAERYERVPGAGERGSVVYRADESPARVASAIAGRWKPAQRINDPGGFFLRYNNDIVAVTAEGEGGSRIYVDDENRGYARWYPYIGGSWGTFTGRGEGFRGGGPAGGK
jgi:hypothetical protein